MSDFETGFQSGLRISIKPVIATLIFLAVLLVAFNHLPSDPPSRLHLLFLALLLYAVSAVASRLDQWKSWAGRGLVIATLVAVVYLGERWLHVPGLLALWRYPLLWLRP